MMDENCETNMLENKELIEVMARAICKYDEGCSSIVHEIFTNTKVDDTGCTPGDHYRNRARSAFNALMQFKAIQQREEN